VLAETERVVGGSVAIHFFSRPFNWTPSNLNIFCPPSPIGRTFPDPLAIILYFLINHEGYKTHFIPHSPQFLDNSATNVGVLHRIPLLRPSDGKNVYVHIAARACGALMPIIASWSTLSVNYLSVDVVACAYPEYTLASSACL
ncbi:hypothetical protein OF83DRAFT_1044168, partial [Amylostereum chailletii]